MIAVARSQFCPMRGMVPLKALVAAAGRGGVACAVDRNLWAQVKLLKLCKAAGARIVHAAEVRLRWGPEAWQVGHVTLLCRSHAGWRNLRELCSLATPAACDLDDLRTRGEGLVVLTGGGPESGGALYSALKTCVTSKGGQDASSGMAVQGQLLAGVLGSLPPEARTRDGRRGEPQLGVAVDIRRRDHGELGQEAGALREAQEFLKALSDGHVLDVRIQLSPTMGEDWRVLRALANHAGLPTVALPDASYPQRSDRAAWEVLRAVAEKRKLGRGEAARRAAAHDARGGWGHVASDEEMTAFFADAPEAVRGARDLLEECAAGCEGAQRVGEVTLPDFVDEVPDEARPGAVRRVTLDRAQQMDKLQALAWAGLEERLARGVQGGHPAETYRGRMRDELEMVYRLGFQGYFLCYWEWCAWARENGIPLGPGRGSATGSLVVWCLGITQLDPVEHGLYVERFINPSRVSWPDIDTDVCKLGRPRVIQHLKDRYGAESVGRIISYKALQGKTAVKDVGRALGLSFFRLNAALAGAPNLVGGKAPTVAWLRENVGALRDACDADLTVAECVRYAEALEGCVRESGVHASGVVVSRGPLSDWVPTCLASEKKSRARTKKGAAEDEASRSVRGGELCSQWSMEEVEDAGLVKLDVLGLSTVTHLDLCLKLVNNRAQEMRDAEADSRNGDACRGTPQGLPGGGPVDAQGGQLPLQVPEDAPWSGQGGDLGRIGDGAVSDGPARRSLRLEDISLDDEATYRMIARGDTLGVFQMGKHGLRRMLRQLRPDRFGDLSAAVALYRPGPLKSGMTKDYIARKHGKQAVESLHPAVDRILSTTYQAITYQEQVMSVIRALAGYSLADADQVRKIIGKKKPELLERERGKFLAAVEKHGVCNAETALRVWGVVECNAGYSFNLSHSVPYAYLGYWTAWLKVHYPAEFYASWLTVLCGEADRSAKISEAVYDARAHGVEVLPPDARASARGFLPEYLGTRAEALRSVQEAREVPGGTGGGGQAADALAGLLGAAQGTPAQGGGPGADSDDEDWQAGGHAVRFGLAGLRGLGEKCVASLLRAREVAQFASMGDFLRRVEATKRDLKALVGSGACDALLQADGWTRVGALGALDGLVAWGRAERQAAEATRSGSPGSETGKRARKPANPRQTEMW